MHKNGGKILIVVVLALLLLSSINVVLLIRKVLWPYSLDYSDGAMSSMPIKYLYKNFTSYPYLVTDYPPLLYVLIDTFNSIIHTNLPYLAIRLLGFLATILDSIVIYLFAFRLSSNRKIGLLAMSLFLSSGFVLTNGVAPNPEILEFLFDLIALFLIFLSEDKKNLLYAALALEVAFIFKQSALEMFFAIFVYLLLNRKNTKALFFAGVFVAIFTPTVVVLNIVTHGRFIYSIFIMPATTQLIPDLLLTNLFAAGLGMPLMLLVPFSLYWLYKNPRSSLSVALIVMSLASLTAAKAGASDIYFLPMLGISCIICSKTLSDWLSKPNELFYPMAMSYLLVSIVVLAAVSLNFVSFALYQSPAGSSLIGMQLRTLKGPILTESPDVAIFSNKSVLFEPSDFWILTKDHLWNDTIVLDDISAHKFAAIVFPNYSNLLAYYPQIMNATFTYYSLNYTEYGWFVYTPNYNLSGSNSVS